MARIVPGKPKMATEHLNVRISDLQTVISDDVVIFQEFGRDNTILVLQESVQPHVLVFLDGVEDVDMDVREAILMSGEEIDLERVVRDAYNAAVDLDLIDVGFTIVVAGNTSIPDPIRFSASGVSSQVIVTDNAAIAVARTEEIPGVTTIEEIDQILQTLNPGASAFVPGTVTAAQTRWREKGDLTPAVEGMPETEDAQPSDAPQAETDVYADTDAEETAEPVQPAAAQPVAQTGPVQVARRARFTLNAKSSGRVKFIQELAANTLDNIAGEKPIFCAGLEVDPSFVSGADAFLPVLLVAASDRWAPVVVKAGGVSGFDVRMRRDGEALLGFRVVDVIASSPFTLFTPIAAQFRESAQQEELVLDEMIETFHRWVMKYRLDDVELEDISMKVALGAI